MIITTDLRRGNLVGVKKNAKGDTCFTIVDVVEPRAIIGVYPGAEKEWINIWSGLAYREELEPIILEEHILLKCGLIREEFGTYSLSYENNGIWYELSIEENLSKPNVYIEKQGQSMNYRGDIYFHQLQNLFYAITGDEIKIIK